MNNLLIRHALCFLLTASVFAAFASPAHGQGFAALVSPPRFELRTNAGERTRDVIEITNAGSMPARYHFKTADWILGADGQVLILEEIQPDSCRPWVAIERHKVEVPGGGRLRFRFEVAPPAGTPPGECRFAVLIEGDDPVVTSGEGFQLPVKGRIGIIVYAQVGDANPKLEIKDIGYTDVNGQRTPALFIRNSGNAHGRVGGFLTGTDSRGQRLDISPSSLPIMPGETRAIALSAANERNEPIPTSLPVTIRGTLEWSGGRLPFEHRFD